MGGARCTFRACTVSTQYFPKMSFFHYPVNKKDRLEKWIQYANYIDFHNLEPSQARNRAVCGLHFEDECFMNYKKNKLRLDAIPTLDRLKCGRVLDYSTSKNPKPTEFRPTKEEHLIPPKGTLVWGNPPEFWRSYATIPDTHKYQKTRSLNYRLEPTLKKVKIDKIANSIDTPRILNNDCTIISNVSLNENYEIDERSISLTDESQDYQVIGGEGDTVMLENCNIDFAPAKTSEVNNHVNTVENNSDTMMNLSDVEFFTVAQMENVEDHEEHEEQIDKSTFKATCTAYENEIAELKKELQARENQRDLQLEEIQKELGLTAAKLRKSEGMGSIMKARLFEYKQKIDNLEAKNQELMAVKAEPPPVVAKPIVTPSPSNPPSKAQLFNGIKKYLSASMTALVRMEMFGNSERSWKPDEKQVSVELLKLGEDVYKYFRDEWRFRLPPKKMVESWSNEITEEECEDL